MSLTVYLEESNNFEYFICNLPENDEKKLCVTNKTVKNKAFKNADFIENIFFENCELIEESVFDNCKELKNVIWRKKTSQKEAKAKKNIKIFGIELLTLDKIVIQHEAFKNCTKMQTLILPISKEISIEKDSFKGCSSLRTVVACSDKIHVTDNPFEDCPEDLVFICYEASGIERFARENGYRWINVQ